jgi:hypothetical protein
MMTGPEKFIMGIVVSLATLLLLALVGGRLLLPRPNLDPQSAGRQASLLITKVGGPEGVCKEADQMFSHFGASELRIFSDSDLSTYPTLVSLGEVWRMEPADMYEPARIVIHVGTHQQGYFIEVWSTNQTRKYEPDSHTVEVMPSRIYVHR